MTDRRTLPANGRVGAAELRDQVTASRFVKGEMRQISTGVADLWRNPDGTTRDRQLLYGDHFRVLESRDGFAFGQSGKDGYVGYIADENLCDPVDATHILSVRASHLYAAPDMKSRDVAAMSFGARLRIVGAEGDYFETHAGQFVRKDHLRPANAPFSDPASVAQLFFGAPYLWGGNTSAGIDCSGLAQVSLMACGHDCPADADQQEASVGQLVNDAEVQRGDLFFWRGHVAMAVDGDTVIHATANAMAVVYEQIDQVIDRIAAQGYGPVTSRKRLVARPR